MRRRTWYEHFPHQRSWRTAPKRSLEVISKAGIAKWHRDGRLGMVERCFVSVSVDFLSDDRLEKLSRLKGGSVASVEVHQSVGPVQSTSHYFLCCMNLLLRSISRLSIQDASIIIRRPAWRPLALRLFAVRTPLPLVSLDFSIAGCPSGIPVALDSFALVS
jgi:hypothetical protein